METTIEQLKNIIADQLDANIKRAEIAPDVSLLEDGLGLDSIMLVALISLIEENFGFEFEEDELDLDILTSVQSLADFIDNKRMAQKA